jgi:hypothetical protein
MGVDFSANYVAAAQSIQQAKGVQYGDSRTATLPTLNGINPAKATFQLVRYTILFSHYNYCSFFIVCMDTE